MSDLVGNPEDGFLVSRLISSRSLNVGLVSSYNLDILCPDLLTLNLAFLTLNNRGRSSIMF